MTVLARLCLAGFLAAVAAPALAQDAPSAVAVTIKDHRFSPAEIHVAANKPVQLRIDNQDPSAEEFDSTALQVEKVFAGASRGVVRLRPLAPGRYPFIGEYHSDTAQGVVIAE
jgi:hypothetical protein